MSAKAKHQPCSCGCGEMADECMSGRSNPLAAFTIHAHGMCTACGSVEVALNNVTGSRDLSYMGESSRYPTGYGCEVCS